MSRVEKAGESAKRQRADWRAVLAAPEGRRVLALILRQSNFLGASYAPGDALATAYNEGLRAVGRLIRDEIEDAAPGGYARLLLDFTAQREEE